MSLPEGNRAPRDNNRVPLLTATSYLSNSVSVPATADPATGALLVSVVGGGSSGTQYTQGGATVTNPTGNSLIYFNGSNQPIAVTSSNPLPITGTISVGSTADESAFTAGTSTTGPIAGVFNDGVTALTSGQQGTIRATTNRGLHANLRNSAGTEVGTSTTPLQVSLANTATNATAVKVDGSAVTQPVSGTFWQTTQPVSGTFFQTTQPVSLATNTPTLQSGSTTAVTQATASNLNATVVGVGTAGTPSGGILTVQGATSMTKLLVTPDSVALPSNQSVNVSQINAVTPLMGNGVTGTGSQRVTIASDNTAFSVNATLSAETTKVIGTVNQGTSPWVIGQSTAASLNATVVGTGTFAVQAAATLNAETTKVIGVVRTADGSGNLLTSTSNALDINIKSGSIANTSFAATQATGSNLHTVVDSGTITTVSTVTAVTAITNALPAGANALGTVGTTSAVINVGQKTVSTTAVQISASSTIPTNGIIIQALSTNAASIFVGGSGVLTSTGFELTAGQSMSFTANLNTLYIISVASTTDKICWNVE
jgi:hypothetical protein